MTVTVTSNAPHEYTFSHNHKAVTIEAENFEAAKLEYRKAYNLVGKRVMWVTPWGMT